MTPTRGGGVAVTGMGIVCAIGHGVPAFARALREGRSGVARVPGDAPWLCAPAGEVSLQSALAAGAGLPAALLERARRAAFRSPRTIHAALQAALEGWAAARLHQAPLPAERVALVVAGHNLTTGYLHRVAERRVHAPAHLPGRLALHAQDTDHVGTLGQALEIRGEGCTVGGASASGNVAIVTAARMVEAGAADACLVVGAMADPSPLEREGFLALGAMAADDGREDPRRVCRPFDAGHRGFVPGEAAACLVLESPRSARRRGAAVLARVSGYTLALDGGGLAEPSEEGEARAMAGALERAGVDPRRVDYVSTHGTSSPLGDATELRALRRVLGPALGAPWVNATKELTGHCLHAAGVVEAVATVVQIGQGFVHPNPNLARPIDPEFRFVGPAARPAAIGAALSSSFGFGGFNASVVLAAPGH